jgi:hypothetical protein
VSEAQRTKYLALRRKFEPARATLVIIAESPPISGKYFYNPQGAISEPLFKALMKQLELEPRTKEEGLSAFQEAGWLLVDATYEPVNAHDKQRRDEVIARDYEQLREDLRQLLGDYWTCTPLILLKANVCALLESRLTKDGFNVLNRGRSIYFPSHGRQNDFHRQFGAVLDNRQVNRANQSKL